MNTINLTEFGVSELDINEKLEIDGGAALVWWRVAKWAAGNIAWSGLCYLVEGAFRDSNGGYVGQYSTAYQMGDTWNVNFASRPGGIPGDFPNH